MTVDKLKSFEKEKGRKIKFKNIDLKFHDAFISFLSEKQLLNPNTIGFYLSKVKLFCRDAERKGLKVNLQFKSPDFYVPSNKTKDIYLNPQEIEKIFDLNLEDNNKLNNARDWFVIGLWTGLRVSDLFRLDKNVHIIQTYIQIDTLKTGKTVIVPIHDHIFSILEKRKGDFPRKISDQKYNSYIKDVCRIAGIKNEVEGAKMIPHFVDGKMAYRKTFGIYQKYELVSSHTCRRSFITNNNDLLNLTDSMRLAGHSSISQTEEYDKKSLRDSADLLKMKWEDKIN